jgi:predicted enzyme related to lactoylglutathione lyase
MKEEAGMRVVRVIADLQVDDMEVARAFYGGFLGLAVQDFDLGWVARYTSPETGAMLQVLTHDVAAPENPVISVLTPDIESAYAEARELGFEIVYPLTTEPWGVRRFFVRAPDGNVINVVRQREPPNSR